jgi:cytochrome c oxidase cbb3-type subunit 2
MKMTPLAVVVGSLLILATIVFVVILLPYVQTSQTVPLGHFPPAGGR